MPSLQIPDVPHDVYTALFVRAVAHNRTLEQQAVAELTEKFEVTASRRREILERISAGIAKDGVRELNPPVEDLIREDRDR